MGSPDFIHILRIDPDRCARVCGVGGWAGCPWCAIQVLCLHANPTCAPMPVARHTSRSPTCALLPPTCRLDKPDLGCMWETSGGGDAPVRRAMTLLLCPVLLILCIASHSLHPGLWQWLNVPPGLLHMLLICRWARMASMASAQTWLPG